MVHLFLTLALLFMSAPNFFSELMTVMCLFCATLNYNYCCVLIYIVYTGYDWFTNIDLIGLVFQNMLLNGASIPWGSSAFIVYLILVIFQPIAIYYAFQAYKEFKGGLMDYGGSLGGGGGLLG